MSNNIDFKELWNRGKASAPDVSEIFAKANRLTRKTRCKIWWSNIILSLTILAMIFIWWYFQPQLLTTKIGLILMLIAIVIFLITTNQLSPLLARADEETDTRHFLEQVIRIKHKQEFLNKTMLTVYFILLSIGITLYFIEYASRGSLLFQLLAYGITFAWIIFNWIYIRTRTIKKQQKAINDIIARLEEVNKQFDSPPTP
jgi:Ca2+/Na+ antiporter